MDFDPMTVKATRGKPAQAALDLPDINSLHLSSFESLLTS